MYKFYIGIILFAFISSYSSCSDDGVSNYPDKDAPLIIITNPADGDTVYSNPSINILIEDKSEITSVSYYVGNDQIGEDCKPPYEEIWYAGYWDGNQFYSLYAEAEDVCGNIGYSDTIALYVAPEARIVPQLYQPRDSTYLAAVSTLTFACVPCPGARSYTVHWHCRGCPCSNEWCGNKYIESTSNQVFIIVEMPIPPVDLEIDWRLKAFWSVNHSSEWSETRLLMIRGTP